MPPATISGDMSRVARYIWSIGERGGSRLFQQGCIIVFSSWVVAQLLGWSVYTIYPGPATLATFDLGWRSIFMAVVLMPFAETFLMRMFFVVLRRISRAPVHLSIISAVLWWLLHLTTETWGVHALWLFFVLSLSYLSLERISAWRAVWVVSLMHAGCNSLSWGLHLAITYFSP